MPASTAVFADKGVRLDPGAFEREFTFLLEIGFRSIELVSSQDPDVSCKDGSFSLEEQRFQIQEFLQLLQAGQPPSRRAGWRDADDQHPPPRRAEPAPVGGERAGLLPGLAGGLQPGAVQPAPLAQGAEVQPELSARRDGEFDPGRHQAPCRRFSQGVVRLAQGRGGDVPVRPPLEEPATGAVFPSSAARG